MNVQYDFSGRVVIITGAARGVGRAMVHQFVAAGAKVIASDRDSDGLAETVASLSEDQARAVIADIRDAEEAAKIIQSAFDAFGRLDVCVNNAAVAPHAALLDETVEVWDTVYAVNCRGTFLMTQAAGRAMRDQGEGGRIINFSSGVSNRGSAGAAAYASSRAATESFTRVAAIELAVHDILVTCVSPGLIDTQPKPLPPSMKQGLAKRVPTLPLARPGEPEEVGNLVMWLASDASSYAVGHIYAVDGAAGIGTRAGHDIVDEDIRYDWVTGRERS
ncbi:MAG: SDR family oxidoreductase [Trueperaceae bacterium]|nr:SDR family oxidoreductase [Trueperaceae bacterium]